MNSRIRVRPLRLLFFACCWVLLGSSCQRVPVPLVTAMTTFKDSLFICRLTRHPSVFELSVSNPGHSTRQFYITPVGVNLFTTDSILASVLRPGMSDKQKAIALWQLMCLYRYHCDPHSSSQPFHNPAELLNTFACGLCDDVNSSLVHLARLAGMPARLMGLSGHAIAEIYFDGGWHFFDADSQNYFERKDGHIYSLHELAQDKHLFDTRPLPFIKKRLLESTICSEEDNFENHYNRYVDSNYQALLTLAPQAQLVFKAVTAQPYRSLIAYLNQDTLPQYSSRGVYRHTVQLPRITSTVTQHMNFAITQVHVRAYFPKGRYRVYYSNDRQHWWYKGELTEGLSEVIIRPGDAGGEKFTFSYDLKFEPLEPGNDSCQLVIENEFMCSARTLFNNPDKGFRIIPMNHTDLKDLDITVKAE